MTAVWTRLALSGLAHARDFIARERPSAAAHMIDRIEAATAALSSHPEIGRAGRIPGTRELVITGTPFIIPYRLTGKRIEVLAVIHASRRWPGTL